MSKVITPVLSHEVYKQIRQHTIQCCKEEEQQVRSKSLMLSCPVSEEWLIELAEWLKDTRNSESNLCHLEIIETSLGIRIEKANDLGDGSVGFILNYDETSVMISQKVFPEPNKFFYGAEEVHAFSAFAGAFFDARQNDQFIIRKDIPVSLRCGFIVVKSSKPEWHQIPFKSLSLFIKINDILLEN